MKNKKIIKKIEELTVELSEIKSTHWKYNTEKKDAILEKIAVLKDTLYLKIDMKNEGWL